MSQEQSSATAEITRLKLLTSQLKERLSLANARAVSAAEVNQRLEEKCKKDFNCTLEQLPAVLQQLRDRLPILEKELTSIMETLA